MNQKPKDQCNYCPHIIKLKDPKCDKCGSFVCMACGKCTCKKTRKVNVPF